MQKVRKFKYWLEEERLNRGLTQRDLAKALGVSFITIHNLESGKTLPRINTLNIISKFFEISIKEIREMIEVQ